MSLFNVAKRVGAAMRLISSRRRVLRIASRHGFAMRREGDSRMRRLASGDFAVFVHPRWRRLYMRTFIRAAKAQDHASFLWVCRPTPGQVGCVLPGDRVLLIGKAAPVSCARCGALGEGVYTMMAVQRKEQRA